MRLASPYPCCGPIVANVLRTISDSVPSQTSVLSAIHLPIGSPYIYITGFLWDCNRSYAFSEGPRLRGSCCEIPCTNHGRTIGWITEVRSGIYVASGEDVLPLSPPFNDTEIIEAGIFTVVTSATYTVENVDFRHEGRMEFGNLMVLFGR